jgi:hypothetical protein
MRRDVCFIGGGINTSPPFLLLIVPSKDTPYRLLFQLCPQLVRHKDVANAPKSNTLKCETVGFLTYPTIRGTALPFITAFRTTHCLRNIENLAYPS